MALDQSAPRTLSKTVSLKTLAIMQPTYLPWCGYFDLMDQVDEFILLDNVAFSKQSFQQRNRIRTQQGLQWLTVPVVTKGQSGQLLSEVQISDAGALKKHFKAIEMNYRKAEFFGAYAEEIQALFSRDYTYLIELNVALIMWVRDKLGIRTTVLRASDCPLEESDNKILRLISLCQGRNAATYLSPLGAKEYLSEGNNYFKNNQIELCYHHYMHPEYAQLYTPFQPFASVLDLLFTQGPASINIIRQGRGKPYENT